MTTKKVRSRPFWSETSTLRTLCARQASWSQRDATALEAVLYRRFVQDRQQATAVRPRGTGRMLLARRSVRSKIAFNSVSMPTEAISMHDSDRCCIPGASQNKYKSQSSSATEHLSSSSDQIQVQTPDEAYIVRQLVPANCASRSKKGNELTETCLVHRRSYPKTCFFSFRKGKSVRAPDVATRHRSQKHVRHRSGQFL